MNENLNRLVDEVHKEFALQVGSEQIAQKAGLRFLGKLITENEINRIIEVGSGIGTISKFIFRLPFAEERKVYCYEVNAWCQEKLGANLRDENYILLATTSELLQIKYDIDLIIVDDFLNEEDTIQLIKNTRPKWVFIEGHRRKQRLYILKAMKQQGMNPKFRNYSKTKDSYKLGCTISQDSSSSNYVSALIFIYFSLVYSKVVEVRSKISVRSYLHLH
jgi:hypothetical protein